MRGSPRSYPDPPLCAARRLVAAHRSGELAESSTLNEPYGMAALLPLGGEAAARAAAGERRAGAVGRRAGAAPSALRVAARLGGAGVVRSGAAGRRRPRRFGDRDERRLESMSCE